VSITLALEDHVPATAARGARRWLYAGDDPGFELGGLERVSTADATMAAARELRDPYLDAIGALSRLNASPEWWATHLAAKHPYPSLFARLCGVAAARDLADDGTLVVCSTPSQLGELATTLTGARTDGTWLGRGRRRAAPVALQVAWPPLRELGRRAPTRVRQTMAAAHPLVRFALERTPGYRRQTLSALGARPLVGLAGKDSVLLVTWIDERCFGAAGEYSDPHLGPLDAMLARRGRRVARLVKPLLHSSFAACARAMAASGIPAAFPDSYLSEGDWLACERRVNAWHPAIPADLRVGKIPLARLAREYHREHVRAQVDALTHDLLVRRLADSGVRPELIIFPWEGHAWEQVLTDAVRRYMPGTDVVGYDNLNFSSLALSLYPSPAELALRPLPDRVVTNGATFAAVLRASPFPSERVRSGCALRHTHLWGGVPAGSGGRRFVLAACSIDTAQSIELLRKASAAFGDELVARLHPASDARAIREALPATIHYAPEALPELLPNARMMLYTYSIVPYEALAAGTPPVFVRSESMLDLDQLEPTPDVRWVARTPAELRAVAAQIEALLDRAGWERRASEVVHAALCPVGATCVERFLA
jgi:hypothetical protein